MKDITIGVLGGMGTYATIHLFQQYAELFPAEKEWDRPRIIIDNRCTMPSRVRAFLLNEKIDQLVNEMSDSLTRLKEAGCNRILLACNTSHLFLPKIYERVTGLERIVVNIIETCVNNVSKDGTNNVFVLGSEGTIESKLYQNALSKYGVNSSCPTTEEYSVLRSCIEAVKQNKISDDVKQLFLNMVNRHSACILGCTELPILYEKFKTEVLCEKVYDPLLLGLKIIMEDYYSD